MFIIETDAATDVATAAATDVATTVTPTAKTNDCQCCGRQYALKGMNCPSHCLMFKHINPSYRDLPIRYADFGVLHRNELSGALRGLTRVRKFCQDDAHIFCTEEQIGQEIENVLDFIKKVYGDFNMNIQVGLSTRPDKYIGDLNNWNKAENILKNIISVWPNHTINDKDGAFYGPKLDFKVTDALGREHQLATIQLDFNLPERFNLTYKNSEGLDIRPIMIHRAVFGSIERFIAILLEATQGNLPFFVNPRQVAIVPVKHDNPDIVSYCEELKEALLKKDIRVNFICDSDKMQKKIANCEVLHYSQIIVIGKKEVESRTINIRGSVGVKPFDEYIKETLIY